MRRRFAAGVVATEGLAAKSKTVDTAAKTGTVGTAAATTTTAAVTARAAWVAATLTDPATRTSVTNRGDRGGHHDGRGRDRFGVAESWWRRVSTHPVRVSP